jgi:hypothetical protein
MMSIYEMAFQQNTKCGSVRWNELIFTFYQHVHAQYRVSAKSENCLWSVGFDVVTTAVMRISVFCGVTPCSLLKVSRCFRETWLKCKQREKSTCSREQAKLCLLPAWKSAEFSPKQRLPFCILRGDILWYIWRSTFMIICKLGFVATQYGWESKWSVVLSKGVLFSVVPITFLRMSHHQIFIHRYRVIGPLPSNCSVNRRQRNIHC